jgi:O-antigen/teichoic acid export membrane protein
MVAPPAEERSAVPSRTARNTIILLVLRLVVPAVSLALVLVLSRALGAEGLGRYTLAFSFLTLLGGLGPLGLPSVITRDAAQDPEGLNATLRNALALGAAASVLLTITMMGLGPLLSYDRETQIALLIVSMAVFPYTVGMLLDGAIAGLERMHYMAIAMLAEYVLKVGVGIGLLLLGFGLNAVLLAAVAGRVAGCAVSAKLLQRANVRLSWGVDPTVLRRLVSVAPTFLFTAVFASLYWRVDILMLSKLAAVEDMGYYGQPTGFLSSPWYCRRACACRFTPRSRRPRHPTNRGW